MGTDDNHYRKRQCVSLQSTVLRQWARTGFVLGVVGSALLLTACSGSSGTSTDAESLASTPASSSAKPAASASASKPAAATPVELAQQGAVAAARRYFSTIDTLYSNPMSSLNTIYTISTGGQADIDRGSILSDRLKQVHQSGRQSVVTVVAGAVNLTNKPTNKPNPIFPTVQVTSCNNVSKVHSVDAKGKSSIVAGRKNYFINTLTVVNIAYPAAGSWRVSAITNEEASACP